VFIFSTQPNAILYDVAAAIVPRPEELYISFKELEEGKVLGEGKQGLVVMARYLGTNCAVKKFHHGDYDSFVQEASILLSVLFLLIPLFFVTQFLSVLMETTGSYITKMWCIFLELHKVLMVDLAL
jgi:hypothetical protein